jgi:hypothetical protein
LDKSKNSRREGGGDIFGLYIQKDGPIEQIAYVCLATEGGRHVGWRADADADDHVGVWKHAHVQKPSAGWVGGYGRITFYRYDMSGQSHLATSSTDIV